MHNPVHSISQRSSPTVEDQSPSMTRDGGLAGYQPVFPSGFPVTRFRSSVCPRAIRVLPVSWAEEEPFHVPFRKERLLCRARPENFTERVIWSDL